MTSPARSSTSPGARKLPADPVWLALGDTDELDVTELDALGSTEPETVLDGLGKPLTLPLSDGDGDGVPDSDGVLLVGSGDTGGVVAGG